MTHAHEHYCVDCADYWEHASVNCCLPSDAPCPEHLEVEDPEQEDDEDQC